jgi:hypothetical protein
MILKTKALSIIIPAVLIVGIGSSMALGIWNTESSKQPSKINDSELNSFDPQSISGSYTFTEIADFYEVPIDVLYAAFSISNEFNPSEFQAKSLGSIYETLDIEIGTESVQAFVALYQNLPFILVDIYLPTDAVNLILNHNLALTVDQISYLETHTITVVALDPSEVVFSEEESSTGFTVSGPTTIQEVIDAGLSKTAIETIVGYKIDFTNQTVKDFCIDKGLSFGEIKVLLADAVNQ